MSVPHPEKVKESPGFNLPESNEPSSAVAVGGLSASLMQRYRVSRIDSGIDQIEEVALYGNRPHASLLAKARRRRIREEGASSLPVTFSWYRLSKRSGCSVKRAKGETTCPLVSSVYW